MMDSSPSKNSAPEKTEDLIATKTKSWCDQIVEAKKNSSDHGAFLKEAFSILIKTIGFIIAVVAALGVQVAMIVLGALNLENCPAQRFVPIWLVVGGSVGVLSTLMSFCRSCRAKAKKCKEVKEEKDEKDKKSDSTLSKAFSSLLGLFEFAWFIAGSVWIFGIYLPNTNDTSQSNYCDAASYYFGFVLLIVSYSLMLLFCCCGCLVSCFAAKYVKDSLNKDAEAGETKQ